ncbi:MAG: hypothetical protein R3E48_11910 [Burkholderiaceae bacterium]
MLLLSPAANALARSPEESAWLDRLAGIDEASCRPPYARASPGLARNGTRGPIRAGRFEAITASLLRPAPLDLRVNLLKGSRDEALAVLAADGIDAGPSPLAATALRVRGKPALERSRAFVDGLSKSRTPESQALCAFAGPRRGQTVVDLCAGAGGKTLAMAAAMRSRGQVFACDVRPPAWLGCDRAGALWREYATDAHRERGGSQVDSPAFARRPRSRRCAMQRNRQCCVAIPTPRRFAPDAIARLANQQRAISVPLRGWRRAVCSCMPPGSLLEAENEAVAAWFDLMPAGSGARTRGCSTPGAMNEGSYD